MKCFENNLKTITETAASQTNKTAADFCGALRSEERRVGKECAE